MKTLIASSTCASMVEVKQDFYAGYTYHTLTMGNYVFAERVGPQDPLISGPELAALKRAQSLGSEVNLYFGVDGRIEVEQSGNPCD